MSHMLTLHLLGQNVAAMARWYAEVLGATTAQPIAALRFTFRQRGQHDQPITRSHVQAVALEHTELGYYKCVVERCPSLVRLRPT